MTFFKRWFTLYLRAFLTWVVVVRRDMSISNALRLD